jgi:hypothetical protein
MSSSTFATVIIAAADQAAAQAALASMGLVPVETPVEGSAE